MLLIGRVLVGLLLLVLGRRLYWLFVAGVGFLYGLKLAPLLMPEQSETVIVIVALVLALVGALVAVVATKVVLGVIGFVAGRFAEAPTNHVLIKNYAVVGVHWAFYRRVAPEWIPRWQGRLNDLWAERKIGRASCRERVS